MGGLPVRSITLSLCLLALAVSLALADKKTADDKKPKPTQLTAARTKATVEVGAVVLCGVPENRAEELLVKVNGETIKKPKTERSGPSGAGHKNFVFEAKKAGKYKIEVVP